MVMHVKPLTSNSIDIEILSYLSALQSLNYSFNIYPSLYIVTLITNCVYPDLICCYIIVLNTYTSCLVPFIAIKLNISTIKYIFYWYCWSCIFIVIVKYPFITSTRDQLWYMRWGLAHRVCVFHPWWGQFWPMKPNQDIILYLVPS